MEVKVARLCRFTRKLLCLSAALFSAIGLLCYGGAAEDALLLPAAQLVQRVTPEYAERVHFRLEPGREQPCIRAQGENAILISAGNVRECIRAYGYYLRRIAHVHLSWNGDNMSAAEFVVPTQAIEVPPTLPINYAFNYCAMSYTAVHWSRDRWMQEIDRLALNGFHYILVTSGVEKVWQLFLEEQTEGFIANPCYSAWWNMGNLEGADHPVSQELIDSEAKLGHDIVQRITELGMEPVLQSYVGFYPSSKPGESIIPQGKWVANYYRPFLLRGDTQLFQLRAKRWYECLEQVYGYRATAFAGDLFHEGGITKGLPLKSIAAGVQQAMQAYSPGALWFIQAWAGNPRPELLDGLNPNYTVILALQKNLSPDVDVSRNYGNHRYVWCELANFGGKQGLYGGLDVLERMEGNASGASGFGLLSEGLETNPLYYSLFFERINNRGAIDRQEFLADYVYSRYGVQDYRLRLAAHLLSISVYTPDAEREGGVENIMCARPNLDADKVSTWSNPNLYYNPEDVLLAGKLMLDVAKEQPELLERATFRYDLVDVCRQTLSDRARKQLTICKQAWAAGNMNTFRAESDAFCALISQTANILSTDANFLLGAWLSGAEQRAPKAKEEMTRNLRRLITMWSENPSSLNDYAHRQYAEMLTCYYLPRWRAYFNALLEGKATGEMLTEVVRNNGEEIVHRSWANEQIDAIEQSFPTAELPLLTEPRGDLLKLAERVLSQN